MGCPRPLRFSVAVTAAACCLAAFAGCTGRTDLGATGTAPADATHVWVTVQGIWFAAAPDTLPESQTGWTREALSKPVVLDLATASSATLVALATNLSLPSGTYKQMHLELADSGDRLVAAARDAGLDYNAQIDLTDGNGSTTKAPLELPVPGAGLTIPVDLTIKSRSSTSGSGTATSSTASLAITLDAARDVVTYDYGSSQGYILSPSVSVDDEDASGSIKGRVDPSALATNHAPIVASAQARDSAATHRVVVQQREVASDGSFVLYPLPGSKSGKQYDVVITCADADTVVIRDVPVKSGGASAATTLQSTPVLLSAARTVYANVEAQTPALAAGTRVQFYQTLSGSNGIPHLVDGAALDPLTRRLPGDAFALSSGALVVGTYANGNAITFATETPAEGNGGYTVGSAGQYRSDTLARNSVSISGSSNRPTVVTVPNPAIAAGGRAGLLTVNVQVPVGRYDAGYIAVSSQSRLMETVSLGTLLERGGGTVVIGDLPSGSALVPGVGVPYQVSLRAWNSRDAAGTITRLAATGSATLGDTGTASVALVAK